MIYVLLMVMRTCRRSHLEGRSIFGLHYQTRSGCVPRALFCVSQNRSVLIRYSGIIPHSALGLRVVYGFVPKQITSEYYYGKCTRSTTEMLHDSMTHSHSFCMIFAFPIRIHLCLFICATAVRWKLMDVNLI